MIVVTGGAGFIGSNLVHGLNTRGYDEIWVVDHLKNGAKYRNLLGARIADYLDRDAFREGIQQHRFDAPRIEAVFHQGACSTTTEWDGRYMMDNNYQFSKELLLFCQRHRIPFIYASSAAVYGRGTCFRELPACETPLNVYGYSKLQFDHYVRRMLPIASAPMVGLRYFNVYGPREAHKGNMASVVYHFFRQLRNDGEVRLFSGSDGYADGEQRRDFVHVDDIVAVNLWFLDHPEISGIFNVGTGRSQTFNEVADAVIAFHGYGQIRYIPFPAHLQGHYQSFTEAHLDALRAAGCTHAFLPVAEGIARYMVWLDAEHDA